MHSAQMIRHRGDAPSGTPPSVTRYAAMCATTREDLHDLRMLAAELARAGGAVEDEVRMHVRDGAAHQASTADAIAAVRVVEEPPKTRVQVNVDKIRGAVFGMRGRRGAESVVIAALQQQDALNLVYGAQRRAVRRDGYVKSQGQRVPSVASTFQVTYPMPDAEESAGEDRRVTYTTLVANALDIKRKAKQQALSGTADGAGSTGQPDLARPPSVMAIQVDGAPDAASSAAERVDSPSSSASAAPSQSTRVLGRRESDLVHLNEARRQGKAATVHIQRPATVSDERWAALTDDARRTLAVTEDPFACSTADDPADREQTARAYAAICAANPVAFNQFNAQIAVDTYRNFASKARSQLNMLAGAGEKTQQVKQFTAAVSLLERSRPFFVPSLDHVERKPVVRREVVAAPPKFVQWTISKSLWGQRRAENDARDYEDHVGVWQAQFDMDWARIIVKQRFLAMVARSDRDLLRNKPAELKRELDEIKAALQRFTVTLAMTFVYYSMALAAGWTSEGAFCMTLERFRAFAANICVVDPLGKTCRKMNELDCVFVATNFEVGGQGDDDVANDDDALVRFELHEVIVRLAFAKFIESRELSDASDAVTRLLEEFVVPNVPAEALIDPNEFRFQRMMCADTEAVLLNYMDLLRGVFEVYKARERTRYFWLEHWKALLDACHFLRSDSSAATGVSAGQARLIFAWSQMVVVDELKKRQRAVSLQFFDFIEAICRLADAVGVPTRADLVLHYGGESSLPSHPWGAYWAAATGAEDVDESAGTPAARRSPASRLRSLPRGAQGQRIARRPSSDGLLEPQTRPLAKKLEGLCDVLLFFMKRAWGGVDLMTCAARMSATAKTVSGGVELG